LAQNPWMIPIMGVFWFAVYFFVFRWIILRWNLKTPGREDEELLEEGETDAAPRGDFHATAERFVAALGGGANIVELDNCATRLRMEVADVSKVDDKALSRAGAAGTIRPGGTSVQVVYGLNVQFVKDAMEDVIAGRGAVASAPVAEAAPVAVATSAPAVVKLKAPVAGRVVPLAEVPDEMFSDGTMGPGIAIEPTEGLVTSPAYGTVESVFPTGHAIGLRLDDGTELLIHIGIDTVSMKGDGFETLVAAGDAVKTGDPLVRFDRDRISAAGHSTITPVIVLNNPDATIELQ
jgi:N-acetylglucosamine PTS system EIICBA or EIICB component